MRLYALARDRAGFWVTALHDEEYRLFCEALVRAREAAGISQYELADRLGADQSYISKYENARRRLDVVEFLRIVQAIGVDAASILSAVPIRPLSTPPPASASARAGRSPPATASRSRR